MLWGKSSSLVRVELNTCVGVDSVIVSSGVQMESGVGILVMYDLPHVENAVSFPSTLHAV